MVSTRVEGGRYIDRQLTRASHNGFALTLRGRVGRTTEGAPCPWKEFGLHSLRRMVTGLRDRSSPQALTSQSSSKLGETVLVP